MFRHRHTQSSRQPKKAYIPDAQHPAGASEPFLRIVSRFARFTPALPFSVLSLFTLMAMSIVFADATIPTADKPGSKDHPLLKRYDGSFIVAYENQSFTDFVLPLSRLEPVPGKKDTHNNRYYEPKQKKPLEGAYTRLVYLIPANRSPLEVLRNYQQEITQKGGKILFECKDVECGGSATRSSSGGGGDMSLAMFLLPQEKIKDPHFSNGNCAMTARISDQRYATAEVPAQSAHLSILAYTLNADVPSCKAFSGRTIAVIDILEDKPREQKMITVTAVEMAKQISSVGSVALYGIYFDVNKADVKTESEPALLEIAKLLKSNAALKLLVVGHTDRVGTLPFNMDLSQRRAAAVVNALVTKHQIAQSRLMPLGVAFASPVASNTSEEGRAKNRRVELVEL
jgi:OmpA-OmpF porin, OOP family